jgi:hypothetical protein
MVEKPIKKADRVNPPADSGGGEAPRDDRSRNDDRGNRGPSKGGRDGGGRGRGRDGDRDEKPAAVNPVFARGPKPPKKTEVVEAPVEEVTEGVEDAAAPATEAAAPAAATE